MKILLSPSKSQKPYPGTNLTPLVFPEKTEELVRTLQQYSMESWQEMLGVSQDLAMEAYNRIQDFSLTNVAGLMFTGQVFKHLDIESLGLDTVADKLLILCAVYGVLRPTDGASLYRFDYHAKTPFDTYTYWRGVVTDYLNEVNEPIADLTSNEFHEAVDWDNINVPYTFINFMEDGMNQGPTSEKARGELARYIIENNIESLEEIQGIEFDGFTFDADASTPTAYIFSR